MELRVEIEREDDGRWVAEVPDLPGVLTYGTTRGEAVARVQALALRVLAARLEHQTRKRIPPHTGPVRLAGLCVRRVPIVRHLG